MQSHAANMMSTYPISLRGMFDITLLNTFLDNLLFSSRYVSLSFPSSHANRTIEKLSRKDVNIIHTPEHPEVMTKTNSNERNMSIFRMKGIIRVCGHDKLHILQSVHDIFDVQPSTFDVGGPDDIYGDMNNIVIIGMNVDITLITEGFFRCIVCS